MGDLHGIPHVFGSYPNVTLTLPVVLYVGIKRTPFNELIHQMVFALLSFFGINDVCFRPIYSHHIAPCPDLPA